MAVQYNTEWPSRDAFSSSLKESMCWVKPNVNHSDGAMFFIYTSAVNWGYECWRTRKVKRQRKVKPLGHNSSIKKEAICHFLPLAQLYKEVELSQWAVGDGDSRRSVSKLKYSQEKQLRSELTSPVHKYCTVATVPANVTGNTGLKGWWSKRTKMENYHSLDLPTLLQTATVCSHIWSKLLSSDCNTRYLSSYNDT